MKVYEALSNLVYRVARNLERVGRLFAPQPAGVPVQSFESLEHRVLLSSQVVWFDLQSATETPNNTADTAGNVYVAARPETSVAIDLNYTSLNDAGFSDNTLTGLVFRLHFDSTKLSIDPATDITNLISPDTLAPLEIADDTDDLDGDADTDKYVQFVWLDFDVDGVIPFPNEPLPARLATVEFEASAGFDGSTLRFSATDPIPEEADDGDSTPQGELFDLVADPIVVNATDVNYDFDDTGRISTGDFTFFGAAFGAFPDDPNWNAEFDYDNSGRISTGDFTFFGANFGKFLTDPSITYPAPQNLLTLEAASASADAPAEDSSLDEHDADAIDAVLDAAIQLWDQALPGQSITDRLAGVEVVVASLPGDVLAMAADGVITLDIDAAGQGWFIDATPGDSVEFSMVDDGSLEALSLDAVGRIDMLTVVVHELGHLLGLEHHASQDGDASVMAPILKTSTRLLPADGEASAWLESLLTQDDSPTLVEL